MVRFDKLSVQKAFTSLWLPCVYCHHKLLWYEKPNACCVRIDTCKNVVSGNEKKASYHFRKGNIVRTKVFGKWWENP